MKSQERHKLQQNELADWLAKVITATKPYQNTILGAVIVLILAAIVGSWWTRESSASAQRAWTQLFTALDNGSSSELFKVAEDYPSSKAASMANLAAADLQLFQGCGMLFVNKASANQQLNNAAELYQRVLEQSKSDIVRQQATFGLAKTRESQGKLETAMKLYTEVTTKWPNTGYSSMASRRVEDLKRNSTKAIYDKFAQFDPKPAFNQTPGQQPGEKPVFDLDNLPKESPLFTPGAATETKTEEKKEQPTDNKAAESSPPEKTEQPAETRQNSGNEQPAPETTSSGASTSTPAKSDAPPMKSSQDAK
jgi:tetratricopeptide (TPR) repeat protein